MKFTRFGGGRVAVRAVDMQHGEPKMRYVGIGAKKLRKISKRQTAQGGPIGLFAQRPRVVLARIRFNAIVEGRITGATAAALERDYAKEFARFRKANGDATRECEPHGRSGA